MERSHKNSLKKSRQHIVDDLDVNDVFDVLLENDIFNDDIVERIKAETTRKDKARRLLDILPSRGPQAYPVFLEALRENYRWLVDTLENGDRDARNNTQEINNQITEVLMRGGVPHHPHLINRTKETTAVKQGLMELGCGRFLVLHGMPGSGKSVLAAESVRDPAVAVQHFPGGIFWVKIGTVQPEQLLGRIRALCTKLDAPILPNNIEEGQETLRKLFLSSEYSDSLLILDDVWKAEVVKTFNLPVRILITTQDVSIMNVVPGLFSIIELQPGFTEQQSLQLFSTYLKIPVNFLPSEAKEIHNESKGSPMVISMVASLLSETGRQAQTQRQSGRWTYYLQNLRNRRYSKITKQRSYEHESVMGAVAMSIDVLPPQQRSMYEKLAVFLDDDPIHSAALEVLWGVERYEVEDTMNKFIQKSLAMCEYDAVHECFLYSLHDLQLDYLKNRLSKEEEMEMHRMFVDKYLDMVQGKFGDLPHDNYILTHLGYHLYKAEMFDLFSQVYLNLRYVEKVLKNCGTASILYDYRKYHDQISCESSGGQFEEDLLDFEDFCRTAGVIVSTGPCTDIVQLGLSESTQSAVYTAAKILADTEHEYLYLEWKNRSSLHSQNIATILHPGKPTDIKFFPDARVVTSTEEGVIKVWDLTTGDVTQRLHGHYSPISCVSVEPGEGSGTHEINLCTGGEDGCIKTWRSSPLAPDDNVDNAALSVRRKSVRKHSPKLSGLEVLNEIFTNKNQVDESVSTLRICLDTESSDSNAVLAVAWRPGYKQVAVASRMGTIIVYEIGRELFRITGHKEPVNSLKYSASGQHLASASDDCSVKLWDASSGGFLGSINYLNPHTTRVLGLSWMGSLQRLVTLSIDELGIWEKPGQGIKVTKLTRNRPPSWNCVSATESYIAAGTVEDKMVILWSAQTCEVVAALPGHTSYIINMDFSEDGNYLSSISSETMIVWAVCSMEEQDQLLSLGPSHHTRWFKGEVMTAAPDDRNRMTLLKNGNTQFTSPPEPHPISALQLNIGCDLAVFGTSDGCVKVFNTVSNTVTLLGKHSSAVLSLAVTSNSVVVSGGLDETVRIFHQDRPEILCKGHKSFVRDVRLICDEKRVLSCDRNGVLCVWNIENGEHLNKILTGETAFSSGVDTWEGVGQSLVAVAGVKGGVNVLDLECGTLVSNIARNSPEIRVAKFSPDGKVLVTGHDSGEAQEEYDEGVDVRKWKGPMTIVQVWDVCTGQPLTSPLELHTSWVTDLAISKDCSTLLTAGDRLIWWSLQSLLQTNAVTRRRKMSLPIPRSRRTSESKSNRNSMHEDAFSSPNSALGSPLSTPPLSRRSPAFFPGSNTPPTSRFMYPTPVSPLARRKIAKIGTGDKKELLQTFDIKGSSVKQVYVNQEFNQFVTVDDAGILYILDEFIPAVPVFK